MKKALIIALAAFLVAAFCVPVMAQTKVEFGGSYRVRWHYQDNSALQGNSDDETVGDWLDQRFRMSIRFMPSDALTMNVSLEANDVQFGASGDNGSQATNYGTQGASGNSVGSVAAQNGSVEMYESYMAIKTKVGVFSLGRMWGGTAGLNALGYTGGWFGGSTDPWDELDVRDRLKWTIPAGPFTFVLVRDQRDENTAAAQAGGAALNQYDQDRVDWLGLMIYKFSNGAATMAVQYINDKSRENVAAAYTPATLANPQTDVTAWAFAPAIMFNFGPVGIHAEAIFLSGTMEFSPGTIQELDLSQEGYYLDVTYNYGPGLIGIQYLYDSGDDPDTANDVEGGLVANTDYYASLVLMDEWLCGVGPSAAGFGSGAGGFTTGAGTYPGMQHLGLWVDHNLTEDMMLSAGLHWFWANEPGTVGGVSVSDDIGMEFDIGMAYQLYANLTWSVKWGYFWAGDYYKQGNTFTDVGNSWMLYNELTLKF